MQAFLQKLNNVVQEYVENNIQDEQLALKILISHKNRTPNSLNMQYLNNRMSFEKVAFNEHNIYFDVQQFDTFDDEIYISYVQNALYKTARYFLPYVQSLADKLKEEFYLHVWFPINFDESDGSTNVFVYKLNQNQPITSLTIDGEVVNSNDGYYKLNAGTHTIMLNTNEVILDLFNTAIIKDHFSNLYVGNGSSIEVYVPKQAQIYAFTQNTSLLEINLGVQAYVLNYFYYYESNYNQVVYSNHFLTPIVALEPLGGVKA